MSNGLNTASSSTGAVTGGVRLVLRGEGLAILIVATTVYFISGGNPWLFAQLFFVPDLTFAAYTINAWVGALVYNAAHSYILPAVLAGAGWLLGMDVLWQIALILAAHAGFDRSLGYGLKYASGFKVTHLGGIGKRG